jgi:hypothetical protein
MLPNTHHEVWKDLRLINVQGRVSILSWCGWYSRLVLLELVNLGLNVVNDVVSLCEHYSPVLHLPLQLLLHALDLQVLHGLELLKLTGLNLGVTPIFAIIKFCRISSALGCILNK